MTPFNVEDNNITFEIEDEDSNFNISPRNINFRVQNDEIDTDLYPGALVLKDYNLLDNKPSINGVELEGNKTPEELGITGALTGTTDEITPTEAAAALANGQAVILTTQQPFLGMNETFTLNMEAMGVLSNLIMGTATFKFMTQIYVVQLLGTCANDRWEWLVTELNNPEPGDSTPIMDGEGDVGHYTHYYALVDHQHPSDISRLAATSAANLYRAEQTYAIGDYVERHGTLYRCKVNISSPHDWNAAEWEAVVLADVKQDNLSAGDNINIEDNEISVTGTVPKAAMALGIPYGECDNTSTSTVFTATVPGITELKNGVIMLLKNGVVTSASGFTININGLGAKPSYNNMAAATADTTLFNVNYTMLFIYDEDRVAGGCWIMYRGYDSNTNTIGYQLRTNTITLPMDSITYRYRLLFRSVDGNKFVPANNSTSTNATAKRTTIGTAIDPFGGIYYYGTTASVAAGSRPGATYLWQQYSITLGYSFNRTGAALTLTSYKPVYIKATPQASGGAIIEAETPYVQDLPTTNDGKIYIYLGVASSATAVEMTLEHPVYYHDGTKVRLYTG